LSVPSFLRIIHPEIIRLDRKEFTTRRSSSSTRRCVVRLAPIANNSPLLPPVGVWAVSQSQSVRPRRRDADRCLGEPLPHQLANQTRAPLRVPGSCESPALISTSSKAGC